MSCVLRANGENFRVDEFLEQTSLIPCHTYRKGHVKSPGQNAGKIRSSSGLNINVSDAEFSDLQGQIQDAIVFLKKHNRAIKNLCGYEGVEQVCLDFGIEQRKKAIIQYEYFPPALITLAGRLGLGIEISFYPCAERRRKKNL
jgi:hypothetical protein